VRYDLDMGGLSDSALDLSFHELDMPGLDAELQLTPTKSIMRRDDKRRSVEPTESAGERGLEAKYVVQIWITEGYVFSVFAK